jgi:hypothetical protein
MLRFGLSTLVLTLIAIGMNRLRAQPLIVAIALLGMAATCLGTFTDVFFAAFDPYGILIAWTIGLIYLVFGVLFWRIDQHRAGYTPAHSGGLLAVGIGVFILISTIILPILPEQFTLPPPTFAPSSTPTITRTPIPTLTSIVQASATLIPTLTLTPSPLPTLTETPVPTVFGLPTRILPTVTLTTTLSPCVLTVNPNPSNGVNLRKTPDGPIIKSIPSGTTLIPISKSADGQWWQVNDTGLQGWINASVVSASAGCP